MSKDKESSKEVSRRGLLKKYGPYTAPVVLCMLTPEAAYGSMAGKVYSTSVACVSDSGHNTNMLSHCMVDGRAGGSMTHTVINPGPI